MTAASIPAEQYDWPLTGDFSVGRCALLSIDWQVEYCSPGGYFDRLGLDTAHIRDAVGPAARVLAAARRVGMTIIHTREGYQPDLSDCPPTKRARAERGGAPLGSDGPFGRLLIRGQPGWEIIAPVKPQAGEWIIDKPGQGAFFSTDLDLRLRSQHIAYLLLMGTTADCCVSSTLREACDRGYDCLVLTDCVADVTPERTAATLESFRINPFGASCDSAILLEALGDAGPSGGAPS